MREAATDLSTCVFDAFASICTYCTFTVLCSLSLQQLKPTRVHGFCVSFKMGKKNPIPSLTACNWLIASSLELAVKTDGTLMKTFFAHECFVIHCLILTCSHLKGGFKKDD